MIWFICTDASYFVLFLKGPSFNQSARHTVSQQFSKPASNTVSQFIWNGPIRIRIKDLNWCFIFCYLVKASLLNQPARQPASKTSSQAGRQPFSHWCFIFCYFCKSSFIQQYLLYEIVQMLVHYCIIAASSFEMVKIVVHYCRIWFVMFKMMFL